MILALFCLEMQYLLLWSSRKSSNACLVLVLNAWIADAASGAGGSWRVTILKKESKSNIENPIEVRDPVAC